MVSIEERVTKVSVAVSKTPSMRFILVVFVIAVVFALSFESHFTLSAHNIRNFTAEVDANATSATRHTEPKPLSHAELKALLNSEPFVPEEANWMPEKMLTEPAVVRLPQNRTTPSVKNMKKILFWNDFFRIKNFGFHSSLMWNYEKCQYRNCLLTEDRGRFDLSEIDAVMWHPRSHDQSLPDLRNTKAKMVFFIHESPINVWMDFSSLSDRIHLTFTYKTDSDIPSPSGLVVKRREPDESFASKDFHANKTSVAAWFVSHCGTHSKRERLVDTLRKYIPVDIYGHCGGMKCEQKIPCYEMLERKYYFYLSFENSLCEDYMTEKIFSVLKYNTIPVVYGLGPYRKHLPPRSYIDVFDFHSVQDVAKYLTYLTRNATAYNEYFRWKVNMTIDAGENKKTLTLCYLCSLLNKNFTKKPIDVANWFVQRSHCRAGKDSPIYNFIKGETSRRTINEVLYEQRGWTMSFKEYASYMYNIYHEVY